MRLRNSEDRVNMPVLVEGLVKQNGSDQLGIKGVNLLNNEPVEVYLTTRGKAAENQNRPSIEALFEGVQKDGSVRPLKEGGIVSMNSAFKKGDGVYLAQWPFVIRNDKNGTTELCQHGTLIPNQSRDDGSSYAEFYSFHPERSIKATQANKKLIAALAKDAASSTRPAYLVRVVDDKKVIDYDLYQRVYNANQERELSPEEIAEGVTKTVKNLMARYPEKSVDILPATRMFIPASSMEKRQDYFNGLRQYFERHFEDGDCEYCCRKAMVKCGGENDQYCNLISVIEPFKSGSDPVLIGGYSYPEKKKDIETDRQMGACRP